MGSALMAAGPVAAVPLSAWIMFAPARVTVPVLMMSAPLVGAVFVATMLLVRVLVPWLLMPPPLVPAVLPATVHCVSVSAAPELHLSAPPLDAAELPERVHCVSATEPAAIPIPPAVEPEALEVLFAMVQRFSASVPLLWRMAPPTPFVPLVALLARVHWLSVSVAPLL